MTVSNYIEILIHKHLVLKRRIIYIFQTPTYMFDDPDLQIGPSLISFFALGAKHIAAGRRVTHLSLVDLNELLPTHDLVRGEQFEELSEGKQKVK